MAVRDCALVLYKYAILFVPECGVPRQVVQRLSIGARTFWCLSSRAGSMPAGGTPTFDFFSPHVFFLFFIFLPPVMSLAI